MATEPFSQEKNSSQNSSPVSIILDTTRAPIEEIDSDEDGVPDWKSNFSITQTSTGNPAYLLGTPDRFANAENLTAIFGPDAFAEYLSLKQTGDINPISLYTLSDRLANNITQSSQASNYKLEDVKTTPNDQVSVKKYANALASIRNSWYETYQNNPIAVSGVSDPSFEAEIARAGNSFIQMSQDILATSVPSALTPFHLDLANNYKLTGEALLNLAKLSKDPLKGMIGVSEYSKLQGEEYLILQRLSNYFKQGGIIFSVEEAGFFWNTT